MRPALFALLLLLAGPAFAQFLPTLVIEPVSISDPIAYAGLLAEANRVMREQHKTPLFLRTYVSTSITGQAQAAFNLSPSASFAGIMANRETFARAPELAAIRSQINTIARVTGPATYLKAVRFDGTNTPGWLSNKMVATSDETALLERVALIKTTLSAAPAEAPFINVFRVIAGPGPATHLVSINATSSVQLAGCLDALAAQPSSLHAPPVAVLSSTLYEEVGPPTR